VALLGFGYPGAPLTEWSGGGRAHNGRRPDQTESCRACRHGGLLPDCRCCGKVAFPDHPWGPMGQRGDGRARSGNANLEKSKPSGPPEPPSSSLGSALAIFSVPGANLAPPPMAGFFFDATVARLVERCSSSHSRARCFVSSLRSITCHARRRYYFACCLFTSRDQRFHRIHQLDDAQPQTNLTQTWHRRAFFASTRRYAAGRGGKCDVGR
jgi:hypothetical protein